MKCELSEQLIPLYVGGDLSPSETDALRQHLATCAHCRQTNEEFEASQHWLSEFAAPDFAESDFANLRASVLTQIEQREKRESWFQWLLPKWNLQLAMATSAAALAVITALTTITYFQQQTPTAPIANADEKLANRAEPTHSPELPSSVQTGAKTGVQIGSTVIRPTITASSAKNYRRAARSLTAETPLPPEAFQNDPSLQSLEELQPTIDGTIVAEPEEKEMLRMEIQTADPNIRIIWLTPKESGSPANKRNNSDR